MNIKLANKANIKIQNSDDIYSVMQRILLRENKTDRNREHLWTISLDNAHKILNIELVSMGSIRATVIDPMEVFSIPLQKRAVKLVLVHNHPSGKLVPSIADKDVTDRMIQVGNIMHIQVLDHLIISESSYYSFANTGLLEELGQSLNYVPPYKIKERYKKILEEEINKKAESKKAKEIARTMKKKGIHTDKIAELTGLSKASINRLKTD